MSIINGFEISTDGVLKIYIGAGGDVVIPDGVTSIGSGAFSDCPGLTSVTIPDSVTSICAQAFCGCSGLTSITIPDSVTSIGTEAFCGCSGLTSITIPSSVTSIGDEAFRLCRRLTNITIPNSVTRISARAFSDCSSLRSVSILDGVINIGDGAFESCTSLTSITIPNSVTRIGARAFNDCSSLTSLTIPNSVIRIGDEAFERCKKITNITIPNSVTSIGRKAFWGCSSLTSITIPSSVTNVGGEAFDHCNSLKSIVVEEGNPKYKSSGNCLIETKNKTLITGCQSSVIPADGSVTHIGGRAFYGCSSLTSIHIPDSITSIGNGVFSGCSNLNSIEIPDGVTSIGDKAFAGCTNLLSITIPASVESIGYYAFDGCIKLIIFSISNTKCKLGFDIFGEAFPFGLISQFESLYPLFDSATFQKYIKGVWSKLSFHTQAKIYLRWQGKDMLAFYAENIKDVEALGNALLKVLPQKPTAKECGAVAGYMATYYQTVPLELLQEMHERLKPLKSAEKALKTVEANLELMTKLQPKTLSPLEQRMLGVLQKEGLSGNGQDVKLKEYYGITLSELPKVQCKDGSTAPASALGWLLTAHEKHYEREEYMMPLTYKEVRVEYKKPGLCSEAKEIVAELDAASFQDFLHTLVGMLRGVERGKKLFLAYPIGRYADEKRMAELLQIASSLRKRALVEIFENASLYNNTRAAMLYADKRKCLSAYAKLRGTTEDELRDEILSDVGLDENGGKTYDLGNQIVTARMQGDLSFLIELSNGKTAKSLPKKGADEKKYATANADFSNMKKSVKRIATNRKNILFEEFLHGESRSAQSWRDTYLNNPVLRSVASLLVWSQKSSTFTLKNGQPVDSAGQPYWISDSIPIALAHPMEMEPGAVRAWQMYFVLNGIKQPFIQIWEPVIAPATIRRDRYKGMKIPGYRLMSQDKHGITVKYDWDRHEMIYDFDECNVSCERLNPPPLYTTWNNWGDKVLDYSNQGVDPNEFFEIRDFAFRKYTRQVNHIVGLLDKWTLYDFILKDDPSIVERLPAFTLAQVEEFLKLAMDNNCTNVTAALLEYKNNHFGDFDPMAEFTLDL